MDYIIKNATLVNEGESFVASVFVSDGMIAKIIRDDEMSDPIIGELLKVVGAVAIDAEGKYLLPGIIDEHVHFREPGLTQKGEIFTESRAAVAGGVTSFMDMPNTVPQTLTQELLQQKFDLAAEKSLANFSFYLGANNTNIDEVTKTDPNRVCGIKVFMGSSTGNMLVDDDEALERIFSESPCLIAAHCEDEAIIRKNLQLYKMMIEESGAKSEATIHPLIRTAEACFKSSLRAVEMAEKTGARLHIMHISTIDELALFTNEMPLAEKKITAETCPHYLCLHSDYYQEKGFRMKCNPAVKTEADRAALLDALCDGTIDTIGTDHAPHAKEEKFTDDYFTSPSGFPSIQHSLPLMLRLRSMGWMSLEQIVEKMCHNPAILYQIDRRGFIREGYHADLVLLDLEANQLVSDDTVLYKCGWTPYDGEILPGKVTHTFVNGNLVYENGHFNEESRGEALRFNR